MIEKLQQWSVAILAMSVVVCIVAWGSGASTRAEEGVGLTTIARWDFGSSEDLQADRWPDGWTRLRDPKHPGFIPVQIDKKVVEGVTSQDAERFRRSMAKLYLGWMSGRSPWEVIPETIPVPIEKFVEQTLLDPYLRIDMDGSSAEVYSPKIPVDDDSLYGLQLDIQGDTDAFHPTAHLLFFDRSGTLIFQTSTPTVPGDGAWRTVRTTGAYEAPDGVAAIQVALRVEPHDVKAIRGSFGFDRIRVVQMPKIRLQMDRPSRLYRSQDSVSIRFFASGLKQGATRVDLMLYDHDGNMLQSESKEVSNVQVAMLTAQGAAPPTRRWDGSCEWKLSGLAPGYYEIVTQLKRANAVFFEKSENFAVVPASPIADLDPRFGWSLDERALNWPIDHLLSVVREGGTGYIKIPVWFYASEPMQQDRMIERIDRIQAAGIRCVGVIHRPVLVLERPNAPDMVSEPALALEDPNVWQPQLEPVFRAMCMRLVDFQVGLDHDIQYGSNPRYAEMLDWIKKILRRYGTEPTLTVARNPWFQPSTNPSIDRWQWSIDDSISESEWTYAMTDSDVRYPDWTCITPASARTYSLSTRTKDLAARMLASIRPWKGRVTTGWISRPFSDDSGFLAPDGTPREMFVPYRTLIDAIKNREHMGELSMDGGSRNALLVSDHDSCMILWSASPVTEQLFLGDQVEAIDVWGRKVELDWIETPFGPEHRILVDKWPIIIRGVDPKIAMWRMGLTLEQTRLDSLLGQPQTIQVRFNNPFPFSVTGRIDLIAPSVLANEFDSAPMDAAAKSEVSVPIDVLLRPDATSQDTPVRVVATLNTSPPKRFSVSKIVRIGNDDVEFETAYRISDADELWLDIEAINHTDATTSFDCQLFVPERRNERIQISSVEDRKTRTVVLPRASELLYKTLWLRCVQVGTRRILNYRILIEPETQSDPETDSFIEPAESRQPIP
jgi:hypothetical protein